MSVLANRQTAPKARPKPQRFFQIRFAIEADEYAVSIIPAHPDVATKAFRVRKLTGDKAQYDLRLTAYGLSCECRGYLRHQKCKHCDTIKAAEKVFALS